MGVYINKGPAINKRRMFQLAELVEASFDPAEGTASITVGWDPRLDARLFKRITPKVRARCAALSPHPLFRSLPPSAALYADVLLSPPTSICGACSTDVHTLRAIACVG